MSGNTAKLGVDLGRGDLSAAWPLVAAVVLFVAGIALATAISEAAGRHGVRSANSLLLGCELALLAAFMGLGVAALPSDGVARGHGATFYALAALAVVGLSFQTATLQRASGQRLRTTFVTGVLASFAQEAVRLATRARDAARRHRVRQLGAVWLSYLAGAVLGSFLHGQWSVWAMSVPLAALAAVVVGGLRRGAP